jgi:hypothetical protein
MRVHDLHTFRHPVQKGSVEAAVVVVGKLHIFRGHGVTIMECESLPQPHGSDLEVGAHVIELREALCEDVPPRALNHVVVHLRTGLRSLTSTVLD